MIQLVIASIAIGLVLAVVAHFRRALALGLGAALFAAAVGSVLLDGRRRAPTPARGVAVPQPPAPDMGHRSELLADHPAAMAGKAVAVDFVGDDD